MIRMQTTLIIAYQLKRIQLIFLALMNGMEDVKRNQIIFKILSS